ncbi:hypothetical protein RND71_030668 [Anisodus tanguticus]|uniref:Uncharacterized protein n=1 Tax=Anisodus tanguticus TaxID=243964 RepID=A0AAE1V8G7_9SOLA|nr:hypothetical protein RND71_030668 [Anisodus tanguticus]
MDEMASILARMARLEANYAVRHKTAMDEMDVGNSISKMETKKAGRLACHGIAWVSDSGKALSH